MVLLELFKFPRSLNIHKTNLLEVVGNPLSYLLLDKISYILPNLECYCHITAGAPKFCVRIGWKSSETTLFEYPAFAMMCKQSVFVLGIVCKFCLKFKQI